MSKIVFLDRGTISRDVEIPRPGFAHLWHEFERSTPGQVVERLQGAQVAITNKVPIQAMHMEALPSLALIAVIATGTNIIDIEAARRHDIAVCNVPGYAETSAAEHTLALMLSLRRNLCEYREQVIAGAWQAAGQFCFFNRPIFELSGSLLGLIGTGAIAKGVAARARAFGMSVLFHSPSGRADTESVALETLLAESDIVSCHTPLSARTHGLIGEAELRAMKPSAILINTARGEVVDGDALSAAIEEGWIAGAGIDVAPVEPPPPDSPLMRISDRPNVIVTPHVAFAGLETQRNLSRMTIENIEAFMRGEATNLV
ncbi:MAG: glycerate dehydrogenase [Gammaproteobacteria bacterium]|nr:glycerate dehydrogenase [Gammaproteobacteria bacterium]MCY4278297.1 glycerate dehydrogenase [Gammaproteobacteria bacterium]MCY4323080.1 glycerate dehydrogenase [Gammaproteobacteria bacterium]